MPISKPHRERRVVHGIEPLESRIAPAATGLSIGRALDLPEGTTITFSGNSASVATLKLSTTGQLLGFPSGGDGDFLVLSTGNAAQLISLANTGSNQGTDLGPVGAEGDSAAVSFTLAVPSFSEGHQRFKMDFMFLTEEYPEFLGSLSNDFFSVTINGTNYAVDHDGNVMDVDSPYFTNQAATGTYFDGRTDKLTLTYAVPEGVTELNIELRISDVGDGQLDSAVLVDNVRFSRQETVYLKFDGGTLNDLLGPGISAQVPAFSPEDIGSSLELDALINDIVSKLQAKYAAYDILFTAVDPVYGDHDTVLIGGTNALTLDLHNANPLLQSRFPGLSAPLTDVFGLGDDALLGLAGSPDVGNLKHNDHAVIFSGEFAGFFSGSSETEVLDQLVVTIAHEVGHNLGLRHLADGAPGDVMSEVGDRAATAVFGSTLQPLAEHWTDGATAQNDHAYLLSILGGSTDDGTGLQSASVATPATQNFVPRVTQTIYDAYVHITTGDDDANGITLRFAKLDGTQNIALPFLPDGAKISIYGSSTQGGPADLFSGSPVAGHLTDSAMEVALFDGHGGFASVPFAKKLANGTFVAQTAASLIGNNLGTKNVAPTKVVNLIDEDGDYYTITLTGPGTFGYTLKDLDFDGHGSLATLSLEGTSLTLSTLTITVKYGAPNGNGRLEIGEILGGTGAGLKSLTAATSDIIGGGVVFSGALGAVTLHDLSNGADLISGANDLTKTTVRLHAVGDGSEISLGTNLTSFTAARIGDSIINLPSVGKFTVTGDAKAGLTADVAGQIQIAGLLGNFSAGDLASTARLAAGGSALDRTILAMRSVADGVTVSLASSVTSLRATAIGDAAFSAYQFGTVSLSGSLAGDFTAIDKIGRFIARDLFGTVSITAGGLAKDLTALTFHDVQDGVTITLDSSVSSLRAARIGDATITAAAMTSLAVIGDVRAGLAGDFLGQLTLEGGDQLFKNKLARASLAGGLIGASISAESIGTFVAARMKDSTIYAGYTPADSAHPFDGGVFFEGGDIRSFVIRSATAAFDNSVVAAKTIGTIRLVSADLDNGGTAFGFLTQAAPTRVSIPGLLYNKTGPADQSVPNSDLHVRIV